MKKKILAIIRNSQAATLRSGRLNRTPTNFVGRGGDLKKKKKKKAPQWKSGASCVGSTKGDE